MGNKIPQSRSKELQVFVEEWGDRTRRCSLRMWVNWGGESEGKHVRELREREDGWMRRTKR